MPPKIGIVEVPYAFEYHKYAIEKHGGAVAELLIGDEQAVNRYIDQIHGLLLPGVGDIDPDLYGEEQLFENKDVNRAKDEFEISLFRKAMEKNIPVFGICRGIQIMNVAMGGSLYQYEEMEEMPSKILTYQKPGSDAPWHKIKIQPDSRLNQITCESITEVTSTHYEAVKIIGKGFKVTAQAEDGIFEAMEDPSKEFVIGVQYDPWWMWIDNKPPLSGREFYKHAERLFEAFINTAKTYSANHK